MDKDSLKKIISHSKEYGFIFPSSEIYEGLNAVYDYAQNGVLLKNNIKDYWWKSMVQLNDNIVGIDFSDSSSLDDFMPREIHIPKGKPVLFKIRIKKLGSLRRKRKWTY